MKIDLCGCEDVSCFPPPKDKREKRLHDCFDLAAAEEHPASSAALETQSRATSLEIFSDRGCNGGKGHVVMCPPGADQQT